LALLENADEFAPGLAESGITPSSLLKVIQSKDDREALRSKVAAVRMTFENASEGELRPGEATSSGASTPEDAREHILNVLEELEQFLDKSPRARLVIPESPVSGNLAYMRAGFQGEELPQPGGSVQYLNDAERAAFQVTIRGRRLIDANGKQVHRSRSSSARAKNIPYAIDARGNLYLATRLPPLMLNHSSFLGGDPVMCAGAMKVRNGKLKEMDPDSGHYHPTTRQLMTARNHLVSLGLKPDFKVKPRST
jgi:hypothetical protein